MDVEIKVNIPDDHRNANTDEKYGEFGSKKKKKHRLSLIDG